MAITLRLTADQERALALLAESEGVSKHGAAVRAITRAAARRKREDRVRALSQECGSRYATLLDSLDRSRGAEPR